MRVCPNAGVTELPPDGFYAFMCQRLRWHYGYEQSLNHHFCGLLCKTPRRLIPRLILAFTYLTTWALIAQLIVFGVLDPSFDLIMGLAPMIILLPFVGVLSLAMLLMIKQNNWENFFTIFSMMPCAIIYSMGVAIITVYARFRMICGLKWVPTDRKIASVAAEGDAGDDAQTEPAPTV